MKRVYVSEHYFQDEGRSSRNYRTDDAQEDFIAQLSEKCTDCCTGAPAPLPVAMPKLTVENSYSHDYSIDNDEIEWQASRDYSYLAKSGSSGRLGGSNSFAAEEVRIVDGKQAATNKKKDLNQPKLAPHLRASSDEDEADDMDQQGCSNKWTGTVGTFGKGVAGILQSISRHAAMHPEFHIVTIIFISMACIGIGVATNFNIQYDDSVLWTPQDSRPIQHLKWVEEESGYPEEERWFVVMVHGNGENVLSIEGVRKVFESLDAVRFTPGYDEVCKEADYVDFNGVETCPISGLTNFWNDTQSIFEEKAILGDVALFLSVSSGNLPDGTPVDQDEVVGNLRFLNDDDVLPVADSFITLVELPDTLEAEEFEYYAIQNVLSLSERWKAEGYFYSAEVQSGRSFDDEFERALVKDIPLVPMVFIIMSLFTCAVFFKKDRVQSRSMLGFGAVACVLLAIMTGYGIMFFIGVSFTSMTQILPFVFFGIGLDDAFIITGAYTRTDPRTRTIDRISETIEEVGVSIALTTTTSVVAFGLGGLSSVPAVSWLCFYAWPTLLVNFVYQLTFFVAILVIDERRVKQRRKDCCIWAHVTEREEIKIRNIQATTSDDEVETLVDSFMRWYVRQLLRPVVKVCVLVFFAGLVVCCAFSAVQLTQSFDFRDIVPKDSYIITFYDAYEDYATQSPLEPSAYFRFVDQSDENIQNQMEEFIENLVSIDAIEEPPTFFWLRDFKQHLNWTKDDIGDLPFPEQLQSFLNTPRFSGLYDDDIVLNETGYIVTSRVTLNMPNVDLSSVKSQVKALEDQRAVAASMPVNMGRKEWAFFTFDTDYNIWQFYAVAVDELILTTILGVVAVSVVAFVFIPHWSAVFFVVPLISALYIDILGLLQFAGLHINAVSYVALAMSIGLMVDFVIHILFRYYECEGTRHEKVKETLQTMGSSILIGGISTFLGVIPLSLSTSEIFNTIFIAFGALVVLGVSHGLVLLPVVLSLVGTTDCIREPTNNEDTKTFKSARKGRERAKEDNVSKGDEKYDEKYFTCDEDDSAASKQTI